MKTFTPNKQLQAEARNFLTPERLDRLNHLRGRADVRPLTKEDVVKMVGFMDRSGWDQLKERVG